MSSGANRWQAVRDILYEALERPEEARANFVALACGSDGELRREVEELLRASEGTLAPIEEPARTLEPGPTLGRYLVRRKIGEGGMGAVYEAEDPELGRRVALKIVGGSADSERARRRFAREARAASALNHPGIVTVYELGHADGLTFIAMELVEGETLLAKAGAPLPTVRLHAAGGRSHRGRPCRRHRNRDLKPGNLMVTLSGQVKVLDFGLARRAEEANANAVSLDLTAAGQILGTPAYMSPEQAMGEPVGPASDIFSLGVVLYELVCGVRPFSGKTAVATLDQVLHHQPPHPRQANPALPRDVAALIERCLEKSPDARPASMVEVAETLRRLGSPASAIRAAGSWQRLRGWLWRRQEGWAVFRPRPALQWSMEARPPPKIFPALPGSPTRSAPACAFGFGSVIPGRPVLRGQSRFRGPLLDFVLGGGGGRLRNRHGLVRLRRNTRRRTPAPGPAWATPVAELETVGPVDPASAARVSETLGGSVALDLRHE